MASQKPVADTLADKFAKAQQRGKKDATKESATRRTRSRGALENSSSDEEVFQSPTGAAAAEPAVPIPTRGIGASFSGSSSTELGATVAGTSPARRWGNAPEGEGSEQRGRGRRTAAAAAAPPA
jgi:hypothetical protein